MCNIKDMIIAHFELTIYTYLYFRFDTVHARQLYVTSHIHLYAVTNLTYERLCSSRWQLTGSRRQLPELMILIFNLVYIFGIVYI